MTSPPPHEYYLFDMWDCQAIAIVANQTTFQYLKINNNEPCSHIRFIVDRLTKNYIHTFLL